MRLTSIGHILSPVTDNCKDLDRDQSALMYKPKQVSVRALDKENPDKYFSYFSTKRYVASSKYHNICFRGEIRKISTFWLQKIAKSCVCCF